MQYRELGRTGWRVSTISFGAWAIGGTWGPVDDVESLAALHRAVDLGVNLFVALFALMDPIGNLPIFAAATAGASSMPPRGGSLTISLKTGASRTPARPTMMKAARQSMEAAIRPPNRIMTPPPEKKFRATSTRASSLCAAR